MSARTLVVTFAASVAGVLAATPASADPTADPASASSIDEAWGELDAGERALAGGDCVTMCRALQSMARAAQRICALAEGGSDADRQRCVDAKTRVEEATKRVLAACPACNPSPPYAPATAPPNPGVDFDEGGAPRPVSEAGVYAESMDVAAAHRRPRFTVAISPAALLLPPSLLQLSLEARLVDHLSFGVSGGIGRLATTGGDGHATVFTVGGQLRGYLFAPFDGLYLAADLRFARPSLEDGERLSSRAIVPGLTLGPMLGYKLLASSGFTLDTSFGFAVVAVDRRREGQPSTRIEPAWDLRLGYSF